MAQSRQTQEPEQQKRTAGSWLAAYSGYVSFVLAIVGIVSFLGGGILYLLIRDIRTFTLVVVFVGAALVLIALAISYKRVFSAMIGRRGRYGTNTVLMVVAFIAFAGLLNFLFFDIISLRADVTATKQFNLAPQTVQVIENLTEPIKVTAFFVLTNPEDQQAWTTLKDLLDEYKHHAGNKFTYELVDPQEQPSTAKQYQVSASETVVFEATQSGRRESLMSSTQAPAQEQDITGAILAITGIKQKIIYFLEGHDEHSFRDVEGNEGYAVATRGLFADNYAIKSLDLLKTPSVPEDAAVLIIAGPKKDPRDTEIAALDKYLLDGGRALFLLDPSTPQTFRDLLKDWDIKLGKGAVVDPGSSLATDTRTPLVDTNHYMPGNPITDILKSPTLFPDVTAIDPVIDPNENPEDVPSGVAFTYLAFTSTDSWLTEDPKSTKFDSQSDIEGPISIAAVVTANQPLREGAKPSDKTAKIVVFGDSDFPSNFFYTFNSNGDMFLNSVNWLAEDVHLISIRPKTFAIRQLFLTQRERDFIKWSSWIVVPSLVVLMGVGAWWRRR